MVVKISGNSSPTAPSFAGDDGDSGLHAAADQVQLVTNSTVAMTVDSSQNVGIGTASPTGFIHIQGSSTGTETYGRFTTGSAGGDQSLVIKSGSSRDHMAIQVSTNSGTADDLALQPDGGKVGIGTTSPGSYNSSANALVINTNSGGTGLTISSLETNKAAATTSIFFADGTTGNEAYRGIVRYHHNDDAMQLWTAGSERARIDSSGRLLVGTASSTNVNTRAVFQGYGASANEYAIVCLKRGDDPAVAGSGLGLLSFGDKDADNVASIGAFRDTGTWTHDSSEPTRLVFSTTANGVSYPTERMRIASDGALFSVPVYNSTTASAANVSIGSNGHFQRSTSSEKYKTDIETLQDNYADALLNVRPVWYRSTCEGDNPNHGWWGFIAEEVAEIDPRLVHWKTTNVTYDEKGSAVTAPCDPEPEGVAYDRFVPHLLNLIKRQKERIETLETQNAEQATTIASFEARISALEGGN